MTRSPTKRRRRRNSRRSTNLNPKEEDLQRDLSAHPLSKSQRKQRPKKARRTESLRNPLLKSGPQAQVLSRSKRERNQKVKMCQKMKNNLWKNSQWKKRNLKTWRKWWWKDQLQLIPISHIPTTEFSSTVVLYMRQLWTNRISPTTIINSIFAKSSKARKIQVKS